VPESDVVPSIQPARLPATDVAGSISHALLGFHRLYSRISLQRPCAPAGKTAHSAMTSRIAAIALVLLSLAAAGARAQKADLPEVKVGDQWQFVEYYSAPSTTPNRTWVITSVTPTGIAGTDNGEPLLLTRELNVLESPRTRSSNPRALAFPLEPGKRWRYESDWVFKPKGSAGSTVVDVVVAGHERIRVPAGEFDAFKLVAKGRLSGTSPVNSRYDGETTETYWYAPAARAIVKSVRHNPYLGTATVELIRVELSR
jgi:hypothetical protein